MYVEEMEKRGKVWLDVGGRDGDDKVGLVGCR